MTRRVLDAWALLAWLHDERPAARVQGLLEEAELGKAELSMSLINVGEVYYRLVRKRGAAAARSFVDGLGAMRIQALAVPKGLILEAAHLKGRYPISYADAFAVATAIRLRAPLVSGDPELKVFRGSGVVEIDWIGA